MFVPALKEVFDMCEIFDLRNASDEQIKMLQSKALEILVYFRDFCEKYNLTFICVVDAVLVQYAAKGFIPWMMI